MWTQAVARSPGHGQEFRACEPEKNASSLNVFHRPSRALHLEDGSMSENGTNPMHRREFIQAGAAATAAATTLAQGAAAAQVAGEQAGAAKKKTELPRRVLGKTGVEVTIAQRRGPWRARARSTGCSATPSAGASAISTRPRATDTEDRFKDWFAAEPEVRKQIFLATKDHVGKPGRDGQADRPAARGARDRLHRPALLPRTRQPTRSTGPRARR